jgi:hypothetical protein
MDGSCGVDNDRRSESIDRSTIDGDLNEFLRPWSGWDWSQRRGFWPAGRMQRVPAAFQKHAGP